ncbi:hypothetical protein IW261DRAFT_1418931 [Armillaria novae-zelandiae]|uniref:Uncharacterized protein n=1 Tax=Armillaria novae-zelandiae TaxID=153914 RepID=A0AA39UBL6_9AGAR|nr:hypothetical protein IW261DRAFT_1418931 [Armillaria novae-zelandiae]
MIPFRLCTHVHFDDNEDEYIDISGVLPETPPPQLQVCHLVLVQGPLHHVLPPVHQDLQLLADYQVLNTQHQHSTKHILGDILSGKPFQNKGVEQRIFGHSLKLRRTATVVSFASFVRCQKEVGKSVPFHEYDEKGTDSLCSHLISHHGNEWIMACDELKIKISAKNAREAVWAYCEKNPCTGVSEDMLPTDSHNQEFSRETSINAIMTFVVGDDQA